MSALVENGPLSLRWFSWTTVKPGMARVHLLCGRLRPVLIVFVRPFSLIRFARRACIL